MPTATSIHRGMASVGSNTTDTTSMGPTTSMPDASPTLSERELLRIEFYKTYDVMTGVRIAATLGGFFSLMVLLVIYKSRCKSNRQLEDPRLKAAATAAVEEAEAEERALAAALEAIARLPPKPTRGPRRSLCVDVVESRYPLVAPRFASVGGDYDTLLAAPVRGSGYAGRYRPSRRCSSITCSSTASSYLERRDSAMAMPCLPPPPNFPRHRAYDEPWDLYHPIDIQVIQPTPELSPCGSEIGLYAGAGQQGPGRRRAPLASMGSVDPPEPDSRSLGSDSVFNEELRRGATEDYPPDTEDEVSGFSTDSSDGIVSCTQAPKRFLRLPPKKKRPPDRWDRCAGCVPRRRSPPPKQLQTQMCMTISASVESAPRSPVLSTTTTSSSQNSGGALSPPGVATVPGGSPIELKQRATARSSSSPPPPWSQETLF